MKYHIRSYYSEDKKIQFSYRTKGAGDAPFHKHDRWELIYVKSGEGFYIIHDRNYHLSEGCLVITRPLDDHSNGYITAECERWVIQFEEQLLHCGVCQMLPRDLDVLDCNTHKELRELIVKMDRYSNTLDKKTAKEMLISLIQELLCDIALIVNGSNFKYSYQMSTTVVRAIRYIRENIHRTVTVENVAEYLNVSPSYLRRLFVQHIQMSPKQYILLLKLSFVHQDLCNGEKVTEVCAQYGFPDYSSFYRAFKKHFGYKPTEAAKYPHILEEKV